MKETKVLRELRGKLTVMGLDNEMVYHKTKLLLKLYKDVLWVTEERVTEVEETFYYSCDNNLGLVLRYFSDFAPERDKEKFQTEMQCIFENAWLIEIIDRAMMKVKNYPHNGELYFDILNKQYFLKYSFSEREILESLNIERSVFYIRKREAINLLSVVLWGFILPKLKTSDLLLTS